MKYDMPLFRPPSEAFSLILQVTLGCSHNACTFCGMYKMKKFRVKDWPEIDLDIRDAAAFSEGVERIFLADGNALAMETEKMEVLLKKLYGSFPDLKRVSSYAGPGDLLGRPLEELKRMRDSGLKLLYLGVESGSAFILKEVNKGVTPDEMVEAGRRAKEAGFELAVTVLTGLGGKSRSRENAVETAAVLNRLQPDYIGALTLTPTPNTILYKRMKKGEFQLLDPLENLQELKWLVEMLDMSENCLFRCNHASNYLPLRGTLPRDRKKLTGLLADVVENPHCYKLKSESMRGL
ncbi:MAG: B12-binding domain-containing radical SAM protein [Actinobacteria bacterium]|nr:B12-binding domain-containing radical SAM protein [Actinomycetota bacterium]